MSGQHIQATTDLGAHPKTAATNKHVPLSYLLRGIVAIMHVPLHVFSEAEGKTTRVNLVSSIGCPPCGPYCNY